MHGSTLREKYGAPQTKQVFMVRPGIEMLVTFGPNETVCKVEIPFGAATKEELDAIAEEVVPLSMRGKELHRSFHRFGALGTSLTVYEMVTITQQSVSDGSPEKYRMTMTFNDECCAEVNGRP